VPSYNARNPIKTPKQPGISDHHLVVALGHDIVEEK